MAYRGSTLADAGLCVDHEQRNTKNRGFVECELNGSMRRGRPVDTDHDWRGQAGEFVPASDDHRAVGVEGLGEPSATLVSGHDQCGVGVTIGHTGAHLQARMVHAYPAGEIADEISGLARPEEAIEAGRAAMR